MAGIGFRDIVRTLKVHLFTTKVIKSHVKLQLKSNATKIPRESPYSIIENFAACHNTLRGIKLATSQADRLRLDIGPDIGLTVPLFGEKKQCFVRKDIAVIIETAR